MNDKIISFRPAAAAAARHFLFVPPPPLAPRVTTATATDVVLASFTVRVPHRRHRRPSLLIDRSRAVRRRCCRCSITGWCVRARERFFSLRSPTSTTRLNGKREQRCPLRFHMSAMFENRQARCAHLRRTRQKIQFGAKDQRLFAHKGKRDRFCCRFRL